MKSFFTGNIFAFLFLGLLATAFPLRAVEDTSPLGARYFKIRIKIPGEASLSDKHYMDIKNDIMGFGRGGETFDAVSSISNE